MHYFAVSFFFLFATLVIVGIAAALVACGGCGCLISGYS